MVNSDLFLLFKTLTNKEIKQLSAFIDSPFANKIRYRPEAQILLKILQKHAGTDSEAVLAKQNIYKHKRVCAAVRALTSLYTQRSQFISFG